MVQLVIDPNRVTFAEQKILEQRAQQVPAWRFTDREVLRLVYWALAVQRRTPFASEWSTNKHAGCSR